MKKIVYFLFFLQLIGCAITKKVNVEPLYSIIKSSQNEGATFKFYEMITEKNEFVLLTGDKDLKNIVTPSDIVTCNYALINLGAKPDSGYSIHVILVSQTSEKIILKIIENEPPINNEEGSNPLFIIKIRSKKVIEFQ